MCFGAFGPSFKLCLALKKPRLEQTTFRLRQTKPAAGKPHFVQGEQTPVRLEQNFGCLKTTLFSADETLFAINSLAFCVSVSNLSPRRRSNLIARRASRWPGSSGMMRRNRTPVSMSTPISCLQNRYPREKNLEAAEGGLFPSRQVHRESCPLPLRTVRSHWLSRSSLLVRADIRPHPVPASLP